MWQVYTSYAPRHMPPLQSLSSLHSREQYDQPSRLVQRSQLSDVHEEPTATRQSLRYRSQLPDRQPVSPSQAAPTSPRAKQPFPSRQYWPFAQPHRVQCVPSLTRQAVGAPFTPATFSAPAALQPSSHMRDPSSATTQELSTQHSALD